MSGPCQTRGNRASVRSGKRYRLPCKMGTRVIKEDFDCCRAPLITPWNGVWQKVQDRGKPGKAPSRAIFEAQKHTVERQLRTMPRKRPHTIAADSSNSPRRGGSRNDKAIEKCTALVEEKGLAVSNCLVHWMKRRTVMGKGSGGDAMVDLVNRSYFEMFETDDHRRWIVRQSLSSTDEVLLLSVSDQRTGNEAEAQRKMLYALLFEIFVIVVIVVVVVVVVVVVAVAVTVTVTVVVVVGAIAEEG